METSAQRTRGNQKKRKQLLCIDDDHHDVEFLRHCLGSFGAWFDIIAIEDGTKALRYLRREGRYGKAPRPDMIFLDLNMPRKDGRDVLVGIKTDENLKSIPVIIFTSSDSKSDVASSYNNGANYYLIKPVGLEECSKILKALENFWPENEGFPLPS